MEIIRNYLITFFSFFIIDLFWLGFIARQLYRDQIGSLLKSNTNWIAALLFYFFYIIGILFFVVNPAIEKSSWQHALFVGFLFGFITYMTYDLTNLATLKDWPVFLTVVDIAWGATLVGATSLLSYMVIRLI